MVLNGGGRGWELRWFHSEKLRFQVGVGKGIVSLPHPRVRNVVWTEGRGWHRHFSPGLGKNVWNVEFTDPRPQSESRCPFPCREMTVK